MIVGYLMAAIFLVVGIGLIALAPRMQHTAVSSTESVRHVPLIGLGARWTTGPQYVPAMRAIGVACVVLAVVLAAVSVR